MSGHPLIDSASAHTLLIVKHLQETGVAGGCPHPYYGEVWYSEFRRVKSTPEHRLPRELVGLWGVENEMFLEEKHIPARYGEAVYFALTNYCKSIFRTLPFEIDNDESDYNILHTVFRHTQVSVNDVLTVLPAELHTDEVKRFLWFHIRYYQLYNMSPKSLLEIDKKAQLWMASQTGRVPSSQNTSSASSSM